MAVDVAIPDMGESISEVVLLEWLKSEGQYVERDEPICVLETDKANVDLPAPASGVLHPVADVDETLDVGASIATIDDTASPEDAAPAASTAAPEPVPPEDEEGEADKEEAGESGENATADLDDLSPAVRRLVDENDLDPSDIAGTGRGGRIIKQDVLAILKEREQESAAAALPTPVPAPTPAPLPPAAAAPQPAQAPAQVPASGATAPAAEDGGDGTRRVPMTKIRLRIAERLVSAQRTTAMLTTFNEVDLGEVMSLRKRHKERFMEKHGVSLDLMSFFSRATVLALEEFPDVNASIDGTDLVYHDYVNLGIAVSSERGLIVPVLRHAEGLSMAQTEGEIKRLAAAARDNKLTIDELSGGTFTITNGGVFGSLMSTPILNPPQSGILGMHAIKERPNVVDGAVQVRPMMYLALSYDHRVIDGEKSVTFLVRIKESLEDPTRLMLEI